jgi:guanyl-specific ribonuclease Sa
MRRLLISLLVILIGAVTLWQRQAETVPPVAAEPQPAAVAPTDARDEPEAGDDLPAEARETLELIARGGPFPYRKDGSEFRNREQNLPAAPRGYYREYTVPTPGSPDRGARRIVAGGTPPSVWYYTDDHYRSFRPVGPGDN